MSAETDAAAWAAIRKAIHEAFTLPPEPIAPLDGWRMMAREWRRLLDGDLDEKQAATARANLGVVEAAIRCAETGEPQRLPHGQITKADPSAGAIVYVPDAPAESISFTVEYEPGTFAGLVDESDPEVT